MTVVLVTVNKNGNGNGASGMNRHIGLRDRRLGACRRPGSARHTRNHNVTVERMPGSAIRSSSGVRVGSAAGAHDYRRSIVEPMDLTTSVVAKHQVFALRTSASRSLDTIKPGLEVPTAERNRSTERMPTRMFPN